jgi:HNH/ENDO VII superfamily nuclease with conserved GHE residues
MNSSNINVILEVEKILNAKLPASLGEYGNSVFYALSILGLINSHIHTLEGYVKALDDISSVLKQDKYKKKLVLYSKKELFLILIKFCFREAFFSIEKTKRISDKFIANKTSYEITGDELARQYFAIHPNKLNSDIVKKKRAEIDEVMFILTASLYGSESGSEKDSIPEVLPRDYYWKYIISNFHELLPVFHYYGLNEFSLQEFSHDNKSEFKNVETLLGIQGRPSIDSWLYENKSEIIIKGVGTKGLAAILIAEHEDNQKQAGPNEDGTYYENTPKQRREGERRRQIARTLQTISNLSGGIFAVIGFAIGGDKGSDFGASFDGMGGAWLQARMGQQQYEAVGKSLLTNKPNPSAIYQTSQKKLTDWRSTKPQMQEPRQIARNISSPVNNDSRATSNRGTFQPTLEPPSPKLTPLVDKPVVADVSKDVPMRRQPGGGDRAGMTATEKTLTPHKKSTPVVDLPRTTTRMKDFELPEPGHYILRKPPSAETQNKILERVGRTSDGRLRDANTGRALEDGEAVWGHAPNYQFKEMRDMAEKLGWTQEKFDKFFEDPTKWQIEYGPSNSSRVFDRISRQRPVH